MHIYIRTHCVLTFLSQCLREKKEKSTLQRNRSPSGCGSCGNLIKPFITRKAAQKLNIATEC